MKKRLKGLASIWLVAALVCSMLLPVSAADGKTMWYYTGEMPLEQREFNEFWDDEDIQSFKKLEFAYDTPLSAQGDTFVDGEGNPFITPDGKFLNGWNVWGGGHNVDSGCVYVYNYDYDDEHGIPLMKDIEFSFDDPANSTEGEWLANSAGILEGIWETGAVKTNGFTVSPYIVRDDAESLDDALIPYEGTVSYAWYEVGGDEDVKSTSATYVGVKEQGKSYYCAVTFGAGFGAYTINSDTVYVPVSVTGISLDKEDLSLKVGETGTLTADVAPTNADNKTVSWKSSDESVATVDENGKVTAVGAGTAIITVTTGDGGITATCVVTVAAPEQPPVEGIGIFVGGKELPDTGRFSYGDEAGLEERGEGDEWNIYVTGNDTDGYTMTIKGLNVVGAPIALQSAVEKLTLIVEGENALKGDDGENSLGILAKNLTIQGTGSLIAQGGRTTGQPSDGTTNGNSYGIAAERSLIISGGTVTAEAGDSENSDSYGIGTMGDVTITGGTVTARGGTAGKQSHGIGVVGAISISGGTVIAESGMSKGGNSYGIGATGNINIEGTAQVTANGKEAQAQSTTFSLRARSTTPVGGSSFGVGTMGNVTITGGTVTATGGSADSSSHGIGAMDKVTITTGAVTATGNSADSSIGIGALGGIFVNSGSVQANGAQGVTASCGMVSRTVVISGGTVTAKGGKTTGQPSDGTTNGNSYGIGATTGGVTITGGTVTAEAGDSDNASSFGIGSTGGMTITNGTVTANGGTARLRSHGIGAVGNVVISGGTVTATGGKTTDDNSYGVGVTDGDLTITGSTVTAEAGASDNAGSFGVGTTGGIAIQNKSNVTAKGPRAEGSDRFDSYGMGAYSDIRISTDCTIETSGDVLAIVTQDGEIKILDAGSCGKEANGNLVKEFPDWNDTSSFRMWPANANDGSGTGGTVQPDPNPGGDSGNGGTSKPGTGGTTSHRCVSKCTVCGGCTDLKCSWNVCKDKCTLLTMSFTDLEQDAWYNTAVGYAYHNGLMAGVGGSRFDPHGTTTRGMIVTILWNLEGKPAAKSPMTFLDVPADEWYAPAVEWAAAEGVVKGHSETIFAPTDPVTREQLATILWNYAKYKGMDVSVGENTNILSYNDAFDISDWAFPGLQWACGAGIMSGKGDGILDPLGNARRCEAAQMLMALLEG